MRVKTGQQKRADFMAASVEGVVLLCRTVRSKQDNGPKQKAQGYWMGGVTQRRTE